MRRPGRLARGTLAAVLLLTSIGVLQAQVVQPRGVPISGLLAGDPPTQAIDPIAHGVDANYYLGYPPKPLATEPYDNAQPAGVVRTTATEYYVRFYAPNAPVNPSFASGPWIMRASTVRGLTPQQIRDIFALPSLPTNVTNVVVPAGTCLMSGIAGPIAGWGNGGAQQTYLIAHNNTDSCRYAFLVSGINYINQRALGANALWYAPVVGPGNAGNVGSYLDHLPAPAEYSDLYNVYNSLDVLNDGTATRLAPALTELTGENHASALWIALSNADRSARMLGDHARSVFNDAPSASAMMSYAAVPYGDPAPTGRGSAPSGQWWATGGGVFGRADGSNERSGYRYGTGQGIVGYDWKAPDWLVGAAVALETSNLTVDGAGNSNAVNTLRAGTYAATEFSSFTFGVSALLSWDHYVTSRDLPSFARSAAATYDGWSAAFSVDASRAFTAGRVRIEPLAGLTLVGLTRPAFTETGAGALSLAAGSENALKLASRIGATLSSTILLEDKVLRPWLRAFWAHEFCDVQGALTASFVGATAPGSFTVLAASPGRDVALVGVGARLEISPRSSVMVAYDGELGRGASNHSIRAGASAQW